VAAFVRGSKHRRVALLAALLSTVGGSAPVRAQTRTAWQINLGEGIVRFPTPPPAHGDEAEFALARIPAPTDPGWLPAPDPDTIGFDIRSTLCGPPIMCLESADFTYFRTVLCVPDERDLRSVAVRIASVDDGARVTVFNSAHPAGLTPSNGFARLFGGVVTSGDFARALRAGEPNTIVITHVDDCCSNSRLRDVEVLVNDRPLPVGNALEVCNGLDDDCNGRVDDRLGATTCGVGACLRAVLNCVGGAPQRCVPGAPSPEVCNGEDDDCNGRVDDSPACVEPEPEPMPEPPPDAAMEGGFDAAPRACHSHRCDPDLRLGGRAGPVGGCACRARGGRRAGSAGAVFGALVLAAGAFRGRARRGPHRVDPV
jgi:hypothetical protein